MDKSTQKAVAAALAELGLPGPTNIIQTMLVQYGHFVGYKLRYDDGYAIWWSSKDTIELFDDQGELLKVVAFATENGTAA